MPPGQTTPMDLSFTIAKKVCTPLDLERLACAYLASTATVNFDAEKAAKEFGGCKGDSFKRQIWLITKRIKEYKGDADDTGEGHDAPVTPKANGSKKRRLDTPVASAKSSVKKGKKARNETADEVKAEPATADESDGENVLF